VTATPTGADRPVVLLTGAAGPIGTAFCERHAGTYAIVAVHHRRAPTVASQRRSWFDPFASDGAGPDGAGPDAFAPDGSDVAVFETQADLTDPAAVARVVEVALARHGRIDAVVNLVGSRSYLPLLDGGVEALAALFEVNAVVPVAVAARVTADLWRHDDRRNRARNRVVVNVSATAAVDAADATGGRTFGPTKAALNMLSLHLAEELRPFGVRVATIAPAPVPSVVATDRVVDAIAAAIDGDVNASLLLLWDDGDEQL
jgi:NAD(P)-dependent dehydrogenase (short-subunit alcohol dehydrogenase family)